MKRMKMLPVLAGLLVCSALLFTTCDAIKDLIASTSAVGVYVGVFSYDGTKNVKDLVYAQQENVQVSVGNSSLAYLSSENNDRIQQYVLPSYTQGNTSGRRLMYAIDKVIDNLKASEDSLNNKLDNVTIVSFSSGKDQGSVDSKDPPYESLEECGDTLRAKINTETIKGKPITAYSVILSPTENPDPDIKHTAEWVTSGDGNWGDNPFIIRATDLTTTVLEPIFERIATGLPGIQTSKSVTITINGPGNISALYKDADDCNFCAVFNDKLPTDADAACIKGFIQRVDGNYVISNIKYKGGVTGTPPSQVEANGKDDTKYFFNFPNVDGTTSTVNQYKFDGSAWSQLSGAGTSSQETVTVIPAEKKTAVVVLVLDATLSPDEIKSVKSAAGKFIQKLYDQSNK